MQSSVLKLMSFVFRMEALVEREVEEYLHNDWVSKLSSGFLRTFEDKFFLEFFINFLLRFNNQVEKKVRQATLCLLSEIDSMGNEVKWEENK